MSEGTGGMDPEEIADFITTPRPIERRFIALRVEPDAIAQLDQSGGGIVLNLAEPINAYQSDWSVVSHTFSIRGDGLGIHPYYLSASNSSQSAAEEATGNQPQPLGLILLRR